MPSLMRKVWQTRVIAETITPTSADAEVVVINTPLSDSTRRLFRRSLNLWIVNNGSCGSCVQEITAMTNSYYDMERFGLSFVATPRHADCLLVTGPITYGMVNPLKAAFNAVPDPKLVIAVGNCACEGCVFTGAYGIAGNLTDFLPINALIRGCPPAPQIILTGILQLLGRVKQSEPETLLSD